MLGSSRNAHGGAQQAMFNGRSQPNIAVGYCHHSAFPRRIWQRRGLQHRHNSPLYLSSKYGSMVRWVTWSISAAALCAMVVVAREIIIVNRHCPVCPRDGNLTPFFLRTNAAVEFPAKKSFHTLLIYPWGGRREEWSEAGVRSGRWDGRWERVSLFELPSLLLILATN